MPARSGGAATPGRCLRSPDRPDPVAPRARRRPRRRAGGNWDGRFPARAARAAACRSSAGARRGRTARPGRHENGRNAAPASPASRRRAPRAAPGGSETRARPLPPGLRSARPRPAAAAGSASIACGLRTDAAIAATDPAGRSGHVRRACRQPSARSRATRSAAFRRPPRARAQDGRRGPSLSRGPSPHRPRTPRRAAGRRPRWSSARGTAA